MQIQRHQISSLWFDSSFPSLQYSIFGSVYQLEDLLGLFHMNITIVIVKRLFSRCGKPVMVSSLAWPATQQHQWRLCAKCAPQDFLLQQRETNTHKIVFTETPASNFSISLNKKSYNLARSYVCLKDVTLSQNFHPKHTLTFTRYTHCKWHPIC